MSPFQISLPLPPSINATYKIVTINHRGRLACTPIAEKWRCDAFLLLGRYQGDVKWLNMIGNSDLKTPLRMDVIFYFPTLWKRDRDGGLKIVQDVVSKHFGLNDTLFTTGMLSKAVDRENPRVEVTIDYA